MVFLTGIKWCLPGRVTLPPCYPHLPKKRLIMSCRVLHDLKHVSHDAPSVCLTVTEGPASSHSRWTAPSLSSLCSCLYIKTMPGHRELVCPSPWVEPCHYFAQTREKKVWFSTRYRKRNIGMSSVAAGAGMSRSWLSLKSLKLCWDNRDICMRRCNWNICPQSLQLWAALKFHIQAVIRWTKVYRFLQYLWLHSCHKKCRNSKVVLADIITKSAPHGKCGYYWINCREIICKCFLYLCPAINNT